MSQSAGGSRPSPVANGLNGLQTLSFDGTHDHLESSTVNIPQPISLFTVLKLTGGSGDKRVITGQSSASRAILSMAETNKLSLWSGSWASSNFPTPSATEFVTIGAIFDGSNSRLILNGSTQSGLNPGTQGLTDGLLIGANWNHSNEFFGGQIAEIIIFNKHSSQTEREEVEGYLAHKWGLTSQQAPGNGYSDRFQSDNPTLSQKSLNLSNGIVAEVSTGGTEDIFDGGSAFSVSMWVKGWPSNPEESLVSKDNFTPAMYGDLQAWLDASNASFMWKDETAAAPSNGDQVYRWNDLSGKGHHAETYDTSPVWKSTDFNNKPTVNFTNDTLRLKNSGSSFKNWTKFTVATAWKMPGGNTWTTLFGRTNRNNTSTEATWHFMARRADQTPPKYRFRVCGPTTSTAPEVHNDQIKSNNILVLSYDGNHLRLHLNGTSRIYHAFTDGLRSKDYPLSLGGEEDGGGGATINFSEFIVFKDYLDNTNRAGIEGYLAHKWAMTGLLPTDHTYKSTAPAVGGWSIERAASGDDAIALTMDGAGGEFSTNVAMNDGQWHNLTTTFGGGTKKVYVDGKQVGSASQTGSVTASALSLMLGDPNKLTGLSPNIADVRFYNIALSANEVSAIYNDGAGDIGQQRFAITSPATISATAGRSISYQTTIETAYGMTGHDATITYELLNKPSWLSISSSNGLISGTPPTAGVYTFQVKGSNTLGAAVKDVTITAKNVGDWNYALSFTTDFNGGTALNDWNMLVRFSEDSSTGPGTAGFRYSQLASNGGDLRFIDKHGQELKYEIANWNTAGESQVWVRVPSSLFRCQYHCVLG